MTRIEIWNYKTIEHISFEFEGYTLVLGKNFIGKSAIIAAIVSALTNRSGDGFIRYGEKFCQVLIQRDGHSVLWHKEKGDSYYIIDEVPYKKIGRADIPQSIQEMGFGPLEVSGEKVLLWFAKQFEPLFLVNRSRQNFTTDLIASVSNLDPLYKGVDAAKKDSKSTKSEITIRKADLGDAKEEAKKYEALESFFILKKKVDTKLFYLVELDKEIEQITSFISRVECYKEELVKTFPVTNLEIPSTQEYEALLNEVEKISSLLVKYNVEAETYKLMLPIHQTKSLPPDIFTEVQELDRFIQIVEGLIVRYTFAVNMYNSCKALETLSGTGYSLDSIEELHKEIVHISTLAKKYKEAQEKAQSLDLLTSLPSIPDVNPLVVQVSLLNKMIADYQAKASEYIAAEKELKESVEEEQTLLAEKGTFDKCPMCERSFNEH